MRTIIVIFLALASLAAFNSCSKSLLDENPPHLIAGVNLFADYEGFQAGLNGLYALVRSEREGLDGGTALVAQLFMNGTDNMTTNHTVSGFATIAETWGSTNNPAAAIYSDVFNWLYSIINSANTIIDQASNRTDVDWVGGNASPETNKLIVIAEARAVRAWAYRHLTYSWGDVPLSLHESVGNTIRTDWTRTPVAAVQEQIVTDLSFAEQHIPVEAVMPGRITKGAVQHYLSEMSLLRNKPDSAVYWADKAISNPAYKLITNRYGVQANQPGVAFMDMFIDGNINREQGNTEALWVFQFQQFVNGGGTNQIFRRDHHSRYVNIQVGGVSPFQITSERGGRGYGRMSLTKWAIDNYEAQDDRGSGFAIRKYFVLRTAAENAPVAADRLPAGYNYGDTFKLSWSNDITATSRSRTNWPFSRKADWADPNDVGGSSTYNDAIYLRLGETYLLKAEAQLMAGDPGAAASTINILRRRANASEVDAAAVNIDFILDERSRELLLEEQRRYSLLRTGKWLERTRLHNKNGGQLIQDRDILFPIPQPVIDANLTGVMPQNKGFN
ncbi:MAG: RagB/SusD family nutrient uptake outer membrane protein [Candidatus Pseudobacter hemicellulosilyticus]|uniref:RagB/SusD family nutrient uptake outer membrane protein n=1 Tax=Candidatus Pseudobacter hemicellulosilyticus TaxID=3121375 RepID=A0AAJ5WU52_9BACT|nr:MAG: RagB/SusD family nutrient uptake outer membrane protein [Pseudobacter sp.]